MPLVKQPLPIQFAGGVETKQDAKQVPTTRLLDLQNATFIKATTLAKRNGYEALGRAVEGAGMDYPSPVGLARRGSELLLFTADHCYSYRESVDRWSDAGEVSSVIATGRAIARTGTEQSMPDHASNGGITVVSWEDSAGGVWCEVVEQVGGRVLLQPFQLDASGQRPRCIPCGTVVHVLWARPTINRIYVAVINPVTPSATPIAQIVTEDLSAANPAFDACVLGGSYFPDIEPGLLAWSCAAGGFRVAYLHPSGNLGSPVSGLPSAASYPTDNTEAIACTFDKVNRTVVAVLFATPTGSTRVRMCSPAALATSTVTTLDSSGVANRVACELDDGALWWAAELSGTIRCGRVSPGGTIVDDGATRILRGHRLITRAFHDNGQVYVGVVHAVKYFPYVAFLKLSSAAFGGTSGARVVARVEAGWSTGDLARRHLASVQAIEPSASYLSRKHAATLGYRIQLPVESNLAASDQFGEAGIRLSTLDFDHAASHQSAELGRGLYLAGGLLQHYDGRRWAESDFHCAPDLPAGAPSMATVLTDGLGGQTAGAYNYIACYEEVDAQGELHPGACSVPVTVTLAANDSVSLAIPTYRLTTKKSVRIAVFRSPKNQTGEPETIPYYRVTGLNPAVITGANCFVPNDPTVDTVTFIDRLTEAAVLTREPLYTNGGIASNDPVPMSGLVLAGGKSRLWWTDQTDPNVVRYSKTIVDDTAVESAPRFSQLCDPNGGDIVGIADLDGAKIVLKETALQVFGGPGPLAAPAVDPQVNAFTPTDDLTSDVGCTSPGSISVSPMGLVFQSAKGLMLVDRSRQVQRIGSPVDAYNAQRFVRSTTLPDRPHILFLTDDGRTLLFDYERVQWSTFTNHTGYDATVIDGVYHYLRTDGRVFAETPGIYADDNMHIPMRIETAWIKMAGFLQGWQRVIHALFLGTYKSAHNLSVRYGIDYQEAWTAAILLDVDANFNPSVYGAGAYGAGPYGGPGGPSTVYQRRLHLNRRCQAMRFRIEDVEPTAEFGASFELSELLLIGGVLTPDFKVGAARGN